MIWRRRPRRDKRTPEGREESEQIWRREKKIQWGGYKGHGGVLELELGTLGLGSRDSGRDGAYNPRTPG